MHVYRAGVGARGFAAYTNPCFERGAAFSMVNRSVCVVGNESKSLTVNLGAASASSLPRMIVCANIFLGSASFGPSIFLYRGGPACLRESAGGGDSAWRCLYLDWCYGVIWQEGWIGSL
jgi:hypothetical protein